MRANDPNIESLELVAHSLEPLLGELVLVGGCAVSLLIDDHARPPVRHTIDVDLLTEVAPLSNYYELCEKLKKLGFKENQEIICRWTKNALIIDVMPTDDMILGFTNRWYKLGAELSTTTTLPSGLKIRHITAPLLIATKIEAFYGRGEGDYRRHDIEDIINLVDGCTNLIAELQVAPIELSKYIEEEIDGFLADSRFIDAIPWHLNPSPIEQARSTLIIEKLRQMARL